MDRYRPKLAALLLCGLSAAAFGAPSNRIYGSVESGSNWVQVKFPGGGGGGVVYWCHASDCLIRTYKGATRRLNAEQWKNPPPNVGTIALIPDPAAAYYSLTSVPLFALLPVKDPTVRLPSYRAVLARWTIKEIEFDPATGDPLSVLVDVDGLETRASIDAKAILSPGDVVVGDADGTETGKPMALGVAALAAAGGCTPGEYGQFYVSGPAGQYARAFAPIEVLLERAGLESTIDATRARAHVRYGPPAPNGQKFDEVAADVAKGNLSVADNYALYLHAVTRAAAQGYLRETGAPADELSPFEQRFVGCMMGIAGKTDELQAAVLAAASRPADFVSSARRFAQTEVKRLADANGGKPWPPPPSQMDLKTMDWRNEWDGLAADSRTWLERGTQPAGTPFGGPKIPGPSSNATPTVVRHSVAPRGNTNDDDLTSKMERALGE